MKLEEEKRQSAFDRALERVDKNRNNEFNCIPFGLPKFEQFLPGVMQKHIYNITANSSVGKTKFTDHAFLYQPYDFLIKHPESKIKLKFFYYSLEIDTETKILLGVVKRLYNQYGIEIDLKYLLSQNKHVVGQEVYDKVKECRDYFERLEDLCSFHAENINPYGIYKDLDNYAKANGEVITRPYEFKDNSGNVTQVIEKFDHYEPNNPDEYVIVIVDHISLLSPEKGMSLHETMSKFSKDMVTIRNKYGYTIVEVQQQSASQEQLQFTNKGESIIQKLEPSLDGLGDNKLVSRDCDVVLGLFAPARYDIEYYRKRDMKKYGDSFRNLSILKNRFGISNVNVGLFFNGAVDHFKEI